MMQAAKAGRPVFRFAPSPNGRLHLGHAFSAMFAARAAAAMDGVFLLRIEDIDKARSRPEFDAGIIEDLSWLGLHWPDPVLRQSSRMEAYATAARTLKDRQLLYPCFCSRQEIAAASSAFGPDGAPLYNGTCRSLGRAQTEGRLASGEPAQWRLRMDHALSAAGDVTIAEAPALGIDALWADTRIRQANPASFGDPVLIRKDTPASYHLAVAVDDAAQCVTHVTRGMDLYASTDLHVLLQRLLDLPPAIYCHHRLLVDGEGQKLAKTKGSPSLKSLREAGMGAAEIRRFLGF